MLIQNKSYIKALLSFALIVGVYPLHAAAAPNQCERLFEPAFDPFSVSAARDMRSEKIGKATAIVHVGNRAYKILGLLGRGSAAVFLARNEKSQNVVIKRYSFIDFKSNAALAYYELLATAFYRAQGVPVPRVLGISVANGRATLIKEYIEGFTSQEIREIVNVRFQGKTPEHMRPAFSSLQLEMTTLQRQVFKVAPLGGDRSKFQSWLEKNQSVYEAKFPELKALREIFSQSPDAENVFNRLSRIGDTVARNMLFSPRYQKWILIDP